MGKKNKKRHENNNYHVKFPGFHAWKKISYQNEEQVTIIIKIKYFHVFHTFSIYDSINTVKGKWISKFIKEGILRKIYNRKRNMFINNDKNPCRTSVWTLDNLMSQCFTLDKICTLNGENETICTPLCTLNSASGARWKWELAAKPRVKFRQIWVFTAKFEFSSPNLSSHRQIWILTAKIRK